MVDPWAWTLSTTLVVIGWVVTCVTAIVGWVIASRRDRKAAETAATKAEEDARTAKRRFEERMGLLRGQLDAANATNASLRGQLEALRTQARLAEESAVVPKWDIYQVSNLKYAVENGNTFDAVDVKVELSNGGTYDLGDISRGSSVGFLFMEKGMWDSVNNDDIRITWSLPADPDRRHSVTKPSPRYVRS